MCAKKSLISLHIFFGVRRVVVWCVLGWRVVVWCVLGQIPARFYDFFLQNPMRIIVKRLMEAARSDRAGISL